MQIQEQQFWQPHMLLPWGGFAVLAMQSCRGGMLHCTSGIQVPLEVYTGAPYQNSKPAGTASADPSRGLSLGSGRPKRETRPQCLQNSTYHFFILGAPGGSVRPHWFGSSPLLCSEKSSQKLVLFTYILVYKVHIYSTFFKEKIRMSVLS